MPAAESNPHQAFRKQLLLYILCLVTFFISSGTVFFSTLLTKIAVSFDVSIGTVSQLGMFANLVGLFLGFAMGALSLRFKHKSLFLVGVALFGLGELGFYVAPNFSIALLANLFTGIGGSMTGIMIYALIAEHLPMEKRGQAIGLLFSSLMASWVIVAPLSGLIEGIAGWRSVLLWVIFPLFLLSLTLSFLFIPSIRHQAETSQKSQVTKAFKQILLNKSAVACFLSSTLFWIFNTVPTFAVSFYIIYFDATPTLGGIFGAAAAVGGIFGGLFSGRMINRFGRKRLTVAVGFVAGIAAILFTFIPNMWVSVAFWVVSASSAAISGAAFMNLVLEQVPAFRASMISLNSTFNSIGAIAGLSIGGLLLNLYANNFQLLMVVFGFSGLASVLVVFLLAKDNCVSPQK